MTVDATTRRRRKRTSKYVSRPSGEQNFSFSATSTVVRPASIVSPKCHSVNFGGYDISISDSFAMFPTQNESVSCWQHQRKRRWPHVETIWDVKKRRWFSLQRNKNGGWLAIVLRCHFSPRFLGPGCYLPVPVTCRIQWRVDLGLSVAEASRREEDFGVIIIAEEDEEMWLRHT